MRWSANSPANTYIEDFFCLKFSIDSILRKFSIYYITNKSFDAIVKAKEDELTLAKQESQVNFFYRTNTKPTSDVYLIIFSELEQGGKNTWWLKHSVFRYVRRRESCTGVSNGFNVLILQFPNLRNMYQRNGQVGCLKFPSSKCLLSTFVNNKWYGSRFCFTIWAFIGMLLCTMPSSRLRCIVLCFDTDTHLGRLFDFVLISFILLSVIIVMLESGRWLPLSWRPLCISLNGFSRPFSLWSILCVLLCPAGAGICSVFLHYWFSFHFPSYLAFVFLQPMDCWWCVCFAWCVCSEFSNFLIIWLKVTFCCSLFAIVCIRLWSFYVCCGDGRFYRDHYVYGGTWEKWW